MCWPLHEYAHAECARGWGGMCMNVQALTLLYSVLPYCIMVALQKIERQEL